MRVLLLILTLLAILSSSAFAEQIVLEPQGTLDIRQAISNAHPHDTLLLKEGTYFQHDLFIDKPLTIMGLGHVIIDGQKKSEIINITSDSVTIIGLQIQNVGKSFTEDFAGIKIEKSRYCLIENNRLIDTFFGIYLKKCRNIIVRNNRITGKATDEVNSGNAIHLWSCENVEIDRNYVSGHRDGIYFEFVDKSRITGNFSENNLRYGLHFMFSNDDEYTANTFKNNGTGVAVMFSKNIIMRDNVFQKNWGSVSFGLLFKEIYDGELTGNTFLENTTAIFADGSNRILIQGNDFIQNGWAINIFGNCADNSIIENNFIGNTFDVSTNTSKSNNIYHNNYWDQYAGYDLDKDGYGDVPHRPVKLFSLIHGRVPESIILLRSFFIDIINLAEKVTPVMTPVNLIDEAPNLKRIKND